MDTNDQLSSSRIRKPGKKPMQFMFIDSSSHGVNAKPDKAVRSFVMKSARSKKPWSTRQKSPRTKAEIDIESPVPSSTVTHIKAEDASPLSAGGFRFESMPSPDWWSAQSNNSPVSSSPGHSLSQTSLTPLSSPNNVCDDPHCSGDSCGQAHGGHITLANRDGCDVRFVADLECYPVRMDDKKKMVIHNFATYYTELFIPLDYHKAWKIPTMKWVMKAMLSTTGAPFIYAALTSGALTPTPDITPRDVLFYKTEAIRHIHQLLKDPKTRVDDNNIAAVFMLLCIEESQAAGHELGGKLEKKAHLNGLQTMIRQRGGLSSLGSNPFLQTFILMHSVAHTLITFERPYTTLMDANGQVQQYDIPSFRDRPSSARTLRLFQALKLDPTLFNIVANAIVFVGDLAASFENCRLPVNPLELQKHASLLIYRLFDWYKLGEEDPLNERSPVDQSVCLALMIFVVIAANTSYDVMTQTAAQKLKASLSKCLFRWAEASELLVWVLLMGALATYHPQQPQPDFLFFNQYCSLAFADQGFSELSGVEEILDRLRKCIWIRKLDKIAKKILIGMGFGKGDEAANAVEFDDEVSANAGWGLGAGGKEHVVGGLTRGRFFKKRSGSR